MKGSFRNQANSLSLPLRGVFSPSEQAYDCDTLHETCCAVSEEAAARLERAVDTDLVLGHHVEVARLWRMMRRLLRNIIRTRPIIEVPVAREDLAQNRVQRLLDSTIAAAMTGKLASIPIAALSTIGALRESKSNSNLRWADVPAAEVELYYGYKSFNWVLDLGYWQEHFGMTHKASQQNGVVSTPSSLHITKAATPIRLTYFVIRSNMLLGSKMKVGRTTRLRSAPGLS